MKRSALIFLVLAVLVGFVIGRLTSPVQYEIRSFGGVPVRVNKATGEAEVVHFKYVPPPRATPVHIDFVPDK
jgi:hypothetical protein